MVSIDTTATVAAVVFPLLAFLVVLWRFYAREVIYDSELHRLQNKINVLKHQLQRQTTRRTKVEVINTHLFLRAAFELQSRLYVEVTTGVNGYLDQQFVIGKDRKWNSDEWRYTESSTIYMFARFLFWARYVVDTALLVGMDNAAEIYSLLDGITYQLQGQHDIQGVESEGATGKREEAGKPLDSTVFDDTCTRGTFHLKIMQMHAIAAAMNYGPPAGDGSRVGCCLPVDKFQEVYRRACAKYENFDLLEGVEDEQARVKAAAQEAALQGPYHSDRAAVGMSLQPSLQPIVVQTDDMLGSSLPREGQSSGTSVLVDNLKPLFKSTRLNIRAYKVEKELWKAAPDDYWRGLTPGARCTDAAAAAPALPPQGKRPLRRLAIMQVLLCKLIDLLDIAEPWDQGPMFDSDEEPRMFERNFRLTPLVSLLTKPQRSWLSKQVYFRNDPDLTFEGFRQDLVHLMDVKKKKALNKQYFEGAFPPAPLRRREEEWLRTHLPRQCGEVSLDVASSLATRKKRLLEGKDFGGPLAAGTAEQPTQQRYVAPAGSTTMTMRTRSLMGQSAASALKRPRVAVAEGLLESTRDERKASAPTARRAVESQQVVESHSCEVLCSVSNRPSPPQASRPAAEAGTRLLRHQAGGLRAGAWVHDDWGGGGGGRRDGWLEGGSHRTTPVTATPALPGLVPDASHPAAHQALTPHLCLAAHHSFVPLNHR